MLTVMIVDDEMLIRKRIAYGFDWEDMGYQIEAEAENGVDALALLEKRHYDVAIVDIAMPGMNGIELTREIKQRQYKVEIIILTGHSDFTYARQSLQNGVFDYILKPIHEQEFLDTLKRLRQKIIQEKKKSELLERLTNKEVYMDAVLKAKVFGDFLRDCEPAKSDAREVIYQQFKAAGIDDKTPYVLVLFHIETFVDHDIELIKRVEEFGTFSDGVFRSQNSLIVCDIYEDSLVFITRYESCISEEMFFRSIRQLWLYLCSDVSSVLRCGISMMYSGVENLRMAYREAFSAVNNAMVRGRDILAYKEVKAQKSLYYKISYQVLKELQSHIGKNDFASCSLLIRTIFREMAEKKISFESIIFNVNRLFVGLMDMGVISELDIYQFKGYYDIEQALANMESVEEMAEWCEHVIYNLMENGIRNSIGNKGLPIVEGACEYIQEHFQEPELNQGKVAFVLAVSSSYLSSIFKKSMGITMIQYLTMVRMEKAKELLLEQTLNVKEVAELTGYNDEYYFSRCFKKQYGLSPLQLRKIAASRKLEKKNTY